MTLFKNYCRSAAWSKGGLYTQLEKDGYLPGPSESLNQRKLRFSGQGRALLYGGGELAQENLRG